MTVTRVNSTTILVDNVTFTKMGYDGNYTSFDTVCTDDHEESLELFLAVEESEHYKPTATELLMDMPLCLN